VRQSFGGGDSSRISSAGSAVSSSGGGSHRSSALDSKNLFGPSPEPGDRHYLPIFNSPGNRGLPAPSLSSYDSSSSSSSSSLPRFHSEARASLALFPASVDENDGGLIRGPDGSGLGSGDGMMVMNPALIHAEMNPPPFQLNGSGSGSEEPDVQVIRD